MQIYINKLNSPVSPNFNSVENLISYLKDNENNIFNLHLDHSTITVKEVEQLLDFLLSPERTNLFKITLEGESSQISQFNQLLTDSYLLAKRKQFKNTFAEELSIVPLQTIVQPPETKLRKAKIYMVTGKGQTAVKIQQQQEQQQQQQQQQQTTQQVAKRKSRAPKIQAAANVPNVRPSAQDLGVLINRINIHEELRDFSTEIHLNKTVQLDQIWDNLVGNGADKIEESKRKITHVQEAAMEQIVRYFPEFNYGVSLGNLPVGFYLQETDDDYHVLCYNPDLKQEHKRTTNPLALQLEEDDRSKESLGSYQQFILSLLQRHKPEADKDYIQSALEGKNLSFSNEFPTTQTYQQRFAELTASEAIGLEKRKQAFQFFLKELIGPENKQQIDDIEKIIDSFDFEEIHYQGFARILINQGEAGVRLFLQGLISLKDKGMYNEFNEIFLKQNPNYELFLTKEGLKNLKTLADFDGAKRAWWESLVKQHQNAGAPVDFNDLFNAYSYFLEQIGKMNLLALPSSCPLQNIGHMKTALDRLLFILENAGDKDEQLKCLEGLDLSPNGAYLASRFEDYQLVSREMFLSPESELPGPYIFPQEIATSADLIRVHIGNVGGLFSLNKKAVLIDKSDLIKGRLYEDFRASYAYLGERYALKPDFAIYEVGYPFWKGFILVESFVGSEQGTDKLNLRYRFFDSPGVERPFFGNFPYTETLPLKIGNREVGKDVNLKYSAPSRKDYFIKIILTAKENDYELLSKWYYRYIGQQPSAYPIDVYREIERIIYSRPDLSFYDQRSLLALVAIVTTSDNNLKNPVVEFRSFLEAFVKANKDYKDRLDALGRLESTSSLANRFHVLGGFASQNTPTFAQLALIIQLAKHIEDKRFDQCIERSLRFADIFSQFFENHKSRYDMQEEKITEIKAIPFDLQMTHIFDIFRNPDLNAPFSDDPDNLYRFLTLLSCVGDKIEETYPTEILHLANHFKKDLDQSHCSLLLSLLSEINIAQSFELPNFEQLNQLIDIVKTQEEQLKALENDEARKAVLTKLLATYLPNTKIGSAPVNESLLGLISVIKEYLRDKDPIAMIHEALKENIEPFLIKNVPLGDKVFNKLKNMMGDLEKSISELLDTLNKEPPDVEQLIQKFANFESEVGKLIDKPILGFKIKTVIQPFIKELVAEDSLPMIDEFLEKKKFLILLKAPLEAQFKQMLVGSIKQLQTGSAEFDSYLLTSLGELDTSKPLAEALNEYNARFNTVNSFVNELIHLKNRNETDYRRVLKLLNEDQGAKLHRLSITQLDRLLVSLTKQEQVLVSSQLNLIYDVLNANADLTPASPQVIKALKEVEELSRWQHLLPPDAYKSLLRVSFNHNVTNPNIFPLGEMIALKTLDGVDAEEADALFASLVGVIQKVEANADKKLVTDFISKVTTTINNVKDTSPEIVPFVTLVLKNCPNSSAAELQSVVKLLEKLPEEHLESLITILNLTAVSSKKVDLDKLFGLKTNLVEHPDLLPGLVTLYNYPPYPALDRLLKEFDNGPVAIEAYIANFDKDPKSERVAKKDEKTSKVIKKREEVLDDQFATDNLETIVANLKDLLADANLGPDEQFDLAQQFVYINSKGRSHPLKIGDQAYTDLTEVSRAQLRQASDALITQLHQGNLNKEQEQQVNLQLLALMREMFFRSTGKFPRSTQMMSLLLALNYPDNLLMEINTGEGKSINTAILAAMQWVKGGTVDVCTANRGLISQDYFEKGAVNFFDFLGIPTAVVRSDSPEGTYVVGGINYSTVADLSLYRSRAKLEGEPLAKLDEKGRPLGNHLILDESDRSLDDRTLFNFAMGAESGGDPEHNPFAWIYPLINEFIEQPAFQNLAIEKGEVWIRPQDVYKLRIFLDEKADSIAKKNQLAELSDNRFDRWLNAACEANQQVEGINFIVQQSEQFIEEEGKTVVKAEVVPLIDSNPQVGAAFSDGVQQFLQARLQRKETKGRIFPIKAEMLFVASESTKDFIDYYRENGRIIGISGTVGTDEELRAQGINALSLPPFEKNKRKVLDERVKKSSEAQFAEIKKEINGVLRANPKNAQPTLLIYKDIKQARQMYERLNTLHRGKLEFQCITGEESEKDWQEKIEKAGQPNVITIATSLLGRGVDIEPKHDEGLFVIQCYLDTERTTRQIIGRTARNGMVGKYLAIYDDHDLPHRRELDSLLKMKPATRKQALRAMQKQMSEEGAVERHYIQEIAGLQQVLLKQFDSWQGFLQHINPRQNHRDLNKSLLTLREELITSLAEQWQLQLEASDPKKAYPNPYVRRNAAEKLETKALDEAVRGFEEEAIKLWNGIKTKLDEKAQGQALNPLNAARAKSMNEVDVNELFKQRKLDARQARKRTEAEKKTTARHLRYALDVDAAILRFETETLDKSKKEELQISSACTQLRLLKADFDEVLTKLPLKQSVKNRLKFELNTAITKEDLTKNLDSCLDALIQFDKTPIVKFNERLAMQPVMKEFFRIFEEAKGLYDEQHPISSELENKAEELKKTYLDEVANSLVKELEAQFAWAKQENQGWDHFIERGAVKRAANAILEATAAVTEAQTDEEKAKKIRELYKVLQIHQAKLDNLWILSLGHRNSHDVINHALKVFDGLNLDHVINLSSSFRKECKEEAIRDLALEKFDRSVEQVNAKLTGAYSPTDSTRISWNIIKKEINAIKAKNPSIYASYEIIFFLKDYKQNLTESLTRAPLLQPLQTLINGLEKETSELQEQHPELFQHSRFLELKEQQLKDKLNNLQGAEVKEVLLKPGHTGFSEYFDLVITGTGSKETFVDFMQNNSKINALQDNINLLQDEKNRLNVETDNLNKYLSQHNLALPPIGEATLPLSEDLLAQFKPEVRAINELFELCQAAKSLAENLEERADNAPILFDPVKKALQQFANLTALSYEDLSKETTPNFAHNELNVGVQFLANKIKQVQQNIDALHKKGLAIEQQITAERQPQGIVGGFFKTIGKAIGTSKTIGALTEKYSENQKKLKEAKKELNEFENLFNAQKQNIWLPMADKFVKTELKKQVLANIKELTDHIIQAKDKNLVEVKELKKEIKRLSAEISKEERRNSIMVKRFDSLDDVLKYESSLAAMPQKAVELEAAAPEETEEEEKVEEEPLLRIKV